ncbi:MAG: hypothetical protein EXR77_15950 [Myxococcales bacterium]|nr:hypothetical protein [Myxococcales bacterium]
MPIARIVAHIRLFLRCLTKSLPAATLLLVSAIACTDDLAVGRTEEGDAGFRSFDIAVDGSVQDAIDNDSGLATDATPADDASDDAVAVDAANDATGVCEVGDACPCTQDDQCLSGKCNIDPATGVGTCALPCQDGACAEGFECVPLIVNGIPAGQICVPKPTCTPKPEVCNGADDNCDGKTDEGFCFDGNPCSDDICNAAGACGHPNNAAPCDDGNACSAGDFCKDGQCNAGGKSACDDGSACTKDTCDATNGTCVNLKLQGGCEDGDACTLGDQCLDGLCIAGAGLKCDDTNPCSDDSCDPKIGCVNLANLAKCNDGDPCTVDDGCAKGVCKGGGQLPCDDAVECTLDACKGGICIHLPIAATCSDGNFCTEADLCKNGQCVGSAKDCADNSPCTIDTCEAGFCLHKQVPDKTVCDDNNPCTANEFCNHEGKCDGVTKDCNDANPCTLDKCQVTDGVCQNEPTQGIPCTDGNACTLGDACQNGGCVAGGAKICGDGSVCTTDSCDPLNGSCKFGPIAGNCSDNNPCTLNDACAAGACMPGSNMDCNDKNPCTVEACDPAVGKCAIQNSVAGIACDDGVACTQGEACKDGQCQPGIPLACDDGNPCTKDSCNPGSGACTSANNDSVSCDDGNPCTANDTCAAGNCKSGKSACECEQTKDCATKEDGNACNGTLFCEQKSHTCQVDLKSVVVCDETKNSACLTWTCNAKVGKCTPANAVNAKACDADGSLCTKGDACTAGICEPGPPVGCDDGNPCTNDLCGAGGTCGFVDNQKPCNDVNPCTEIDICWNGKCFGGAPKSCDDGNPCTTDSCNPVNSLCSSQPLTGTACNDNNGCTGGEACNAGVCQGKTKVDCNDGKVCTSDFCNQNDGTCSFPPGPNGLQCEDGNQCTVGDACKSGGCLAGKVTDCNDNDPCTVNGCDVKTGGCDFLLAPSGTACSDGDSCTVGDACKTGLCVAGKPKVCSDGNPCILPNCDPGSGKCVPKNGSLPCNDGNACSQSDACTKGVCMPGPFLVCNDGEPCTTDSCNTKSGNCEYVAANKPCNDFSKCTSADTCASGTCTGKPVGCNDNSPCTTESCDPAVGCVYKAANNGANCSDGSACTSGDACNNGACQGQGVSCSDGNPCTSDTCDPKTGCKFTTNKGPCSDGDPCTVGDSCATGVCIGGSAALCTDSNDCTDDACNKGTGECTFTADNSNPCSDGNACSIGEACAAGKCKLGAGTKDCDDANPCTSQWCDPASGCKVAADPAVPCSDGDACTLKDVCINGVCAAGTYDSCDDNSVCTADTCDKKAGCSHNNVSVPCDDGNACLGPDSCTNGTCAGVAVVTCNDNNVCSDDSCDPKIGCVYTAVVGSGATTDVLTSGSGTQASDSQGPSGGAFPTFVNFKGSVPTYIGSGWTSLPNATWVWVAAKVGKPTQDETAEFRQSFNVIDPAKVSASLQVAADNTLVCWVNTKMVLNASTVDNAKQAKTVDVKVALLVGANLLRCQVTNAGFADSTPETNPAGLLYRLEIKTLVTGAPCNDGNDCTTVDVCYGGSCTGVVGQTCDDGNVCTVDKCSTGKGCTNTTQDGLPCEDGNPCSSGDLCTSGKCLKGKGVSCDDGQACSIDLCDPLLGCNHKSTSSGQFTVISVPSDAKTIITSTPGNPPSMPAWNQHPDWTQSVSGASWRWSTFKVADPTANSTVTLQRTFDVPAGFQNVVGSVTLAADGAFICKLNGKTIGVETAENSYQTAVKLSLVGGLIAGANVFVCTVTNPGKGGSTPESNPAGLVFRLDMQWYAAGSAVPCDDGSACTTGDWCKGFYCQAGAVLDCDDNDGCTTDFCDPKVGCGHQDSGAAACDDGNACTVADVCKSGKCSGGKNADCNDYDPCTADTCNNQTGCAHTAVDGAACDDNNPCTVGDACKGGKCSISNINLCNDNNGCTSDACSTLQGCYHNPLNAGACDDGNTCTINDLCQGGLCLGAAQNGCNDNNSCTTDNCDPLKGCVSSAVVSGPCDDGNPCTLDDGCKGSVCASGTSKPCKDGNLCTLDSCDPKSGQCLFVPLADGNQCEDGNPCTTSDICGNGKCAAGPLRECGDGNPCTDDACDPTTGNCVNKILIGTYSCDDGDACSLNDKCKTGVCGGTLKACDDSNPCTVDSCNSGTGLCFFKVLAGCQP